MRLLKLHVDAAAAVSSPHCEASPQKSLAQHTMEAMMDPSSDLLSRPELHYEGWKDVLRPDWGRYNPEAIKPETFAGRVRPRSVCGFTAMDLACNAHRVERTRRDTRLDDMDHFYAVFQVAGGSTMIQNDQAVKLAVGDVAFVDSARPVTYVHENGDG